MSFGSYDPNKQANSRNTRPKRFYLANGSNMYRVLPPVKSLADKNKIAQYWSIFWLTDTQNRKRPVVSVLKKRNGEVIQDDPILTRYEQMAAELNAAVASGAPAVQVQVLKENLKRIKPKKFYAVNVLSASGELGVLALPYTSYQNFENRLRELNAQGLDAVGVGPDAGIFFDFKRLTDERGKVVYPVDVATKTTKDQSGNFIVTYIRSPLTEEEASSLASRAEDLTQLFTEYSYEAMQALATLSQQAFDAVFQRAQNIEPENDGPVDDETQDDISQYQAQNQQQILNPIAQNSPPKVQNLGASSFGPSAVVQTQTLTPSSSLSNKNVANNAKVKNFLFPDKKG